MFKSESVKNLAAALAAFQGQLQNPKKTSSNPVFKSKYAPLDEIWDLIRKPLADNGLSIVQMPEEISGVFQLEVKKYDKMVMENFVKLSINTLLLHSSGEWIESLYTTIAFASSQGLGSALSYARRYSLLGLCGIAQEDDDGNAGTNQSAPVTVAPQELPKQVIEKSEPAKKTDTITKPIEVADEYDTQTMALILTYGKEAVLHCENHKNVIVDKSDMTKEGKPYWMRSIAEFKGVYCRKCVQAKFAERNNLEKAAKNAS